MNKLTSVLCWSFAASGAYAAVALTPTWKNISNGLTGVVPGVSQLLIDSSGSTFYSLTTGGLFKSTDGGSSWAALGNITAVNVIALAPRTSTIYAGTTHGIVASTDGGASWASAGLSNTSVSNLAIDPITPSTLYAGASGHLYKSTDREVSWIELNLGPPPGTEGLWIAGLAVDPITPSTLYVALGRGAGGSFLKSLDGGANWNVIYTNAGPLYNTSSNLVIDPSTPSTLYRINPLQKSTDGGVTWTATGFTGPIANSGTAVALAVDPRNSNTLYVSSTWNTGHAIYKSTNGGQSWSAVDTIIPAAASFVFSPDSSTIFAATGDGVFKSTDGGLNWGEAKTGLRVFDIEVLVGDPVNAATAYAGGNQGLFKSTDGGANWTPSETFLGADSLLIDSMNSNTLYVRKTSPGGCSSGEIDLLKSTDGGSSWSDLEPDPYHGCGDGGIMAMDPVDPNTLYVVYGNDYDGFTIFKTTDGGANWKNLSAVGLGEASFVNALLIDRNTPTILYAATDLGVLRSTDGGATFVPTGLANTPVPFLAIDPLHPNVFYAATSNDPYPFDLNPLGLVGLYKSTDSGATWTAINHGLEEIVVAHASVNALLVDADRPNILYLATSGYGVFESSDGGATWAAFNTGLTNLDVRSLTIVHGFPRASHRGSSSEVHPHTLYAGTPGGVFQLEPLGK